MSIEVTKDSIDLGIVVRDPAGSLAFYRYVVGMEHVGTLPMPGGGAMERLLCGTSVIKLVSHGQVPDAANPPGGIPAATGLRYFTISVADLEAVTQRCADAGAKVAIPVLEIRPGVRISIVEDPEGNWVEFLHMS